MAIAHLKMLRSEKLKVLRLKLNPWRVLPRAKRHPWSVQKLTKNPPTSGARSGLLHFLTFCSMIVCLISFYSGPLKLANLALFNSSFSLSLKFTTIFQFSPFKEFLAQINQIRQAKEPWHSVVTKCTGVNHHIRGHHIHIAALGSLGIVWDCS